MEHLVHVETTKARETARAEAPGTGAEREVRERAAYRMTKRFFDVVVGLFIVVMVIPVVPMIAIMIKLDSRGPVFYRQDRIGRGGRPFKFYKFRSMYVDADRQQAELAGDNEIDGPVFKMRRDPRVTSTGRFLRRSSMDEIPQVLNVLRGDMSIVGPRPPLPREVSRYLPAHHRRLEVKPGITCLWQISGRSHIGFDEWMRLDMEYLRTRSLWTDFLIFVKTIPAVMARRGAY